MSNKVYSPVVVENPIIPAIASRTVLYNYQSQKSTSSFEPTCCSSDGNSHPCRISTSTCSSSVNTSTINHAHSVKPHTYHSFNGKELALQFEKLQCTPNDHDTKEKFKKFSPKYSSSLTLKAVKHQPLKKVVISKTSRRRQQGNKSSTNTPKFVLKPSKLNRCVKAAFNRSYTDFYRSHPSDIQAECKAEKELSVYHDFSAACSKELETIELTSSTSGESSLRPRSSSLPAAGASALQTSSNSPSTSPSKNGNASELVQHSSTRRSRRKHLSKGELNVSKNDSNENSISSLEPRITSRANKRRKSPPGHSTIGFHQSVGSTKDGDKSHDNLDASIDRLADYLEDSILLPKKMSFMAEMMYT